MKPIALALAFGCAVLPAQEHDESAARCRALAAAQDAGTFDAEAALAALGDADEAVARTAAAIVRHEWVELPDALFRGLDAAPRAAHALLRELAVAPRPAAAAWAAAQAQSALGRSLDHRLLAIAARGGPRDGDDMALLLQVLREDRDELLGDGARALMAVAPPRLADAQLGRLHQGLLQGHYDVERIGPLLDRMSPEGIERLVGLVVTLPAAPAEALCRRVYSHRPHVIGERVAAALDGRTPLEPLWLEYCAPLLDRPARVERVVALLQDDAASVQDRAFAALVAARIVDPRVFAAAGDGGAHELPRIRRLLGTMPEAVPAEWIVTWLDAAPQVAAATAAALPRRDALEPSIERTLLRLLDGVESAERALALSALTAIVQRGSFAALQQVFPQVLASGTFEDLADALGRRREPFVHQLLLAELAREQPRTTAPQRQSLRLALVALGDRRELGELVDGAATASTNFVRRCASHVRDLPAPFAMRLLDAADAVEDVDLAIEMVGWAATSSAPEVLARLWQAFRTPAQPSARDGDEAVLLDEVLLRALAAGPQRDELVRMLRETLREGPLPERLSPLPYELLATMPEPLGAGDLRLCAELLLVPPAKDPAGEQRDAARWPDGTFGFPLVAAIAQRLRSADPELAHTVFATAVQELGSEHVSRQRLSVLWQSLRIVPAVQSAIGRATAPLWTTSSCPGDAGEGAAALFLSLSAERRSEFAAAAEHYRRAVRVLLRLPAARRDARWLLGERDPGAGSDPHAALAAAPHRSARRAALQHGDAAAAERAAQLVREFAGHDLATLATLPTPKSEETGR